MHIPTQDDGLLLLHDECNLKSHFINGYLLRQSPEIDDNYFIMRKLSNSNPLLSSMLSSTKEDKTFKGSGQEVTTDGRPELDPI